MGLSPYFPESFEFGNLGRFFPGEFVLFGSVFGEIREGDDDVRLGVYEKWQGKKDKRGDESRGHTEAGELFA